MELTTGQNDKYSMSFYVKHTDDDQNVQAHLRPILNKIQEDRVRIKELQIEYAVFFSQFVVNYMQELQETAKQQELSSSRSNITSLIINKMEEIEKKYPGPPEETEDVSTKNKPAERNSSA